VARRAPAPTGAVVLSDASAVRALAHPARLVVIDALYAGRELTATECAVLAGTTPSAMSYHLRALEKYGLVRRAEARGDARQRPWVRAGDTLSIDLKGSDGAGSSLAAAGLLVESSLRMDLQRLLATMRADAAAPGESQWSATSTYARDQLLMTADEARALRAAVEELIAPYAWEKRQASPPAGATVFSFSVVLAREVEGG
jgi:DNA-binding transcriptional ArsR family regulator